MIPCVGCQNPLAEPVFIFDRKAYCQWKCATAVPSMKTEPIMCTCFNRRCLAKIPSDEAKSFDGMLYCADCVEALKQQRPQPKETHEVEA
jgi:hypothetical protein